MKHTVYALLESEHLRYNNSIATRRSLAFNYLKEFLNENDPENFPAQFACLSEFFHLLFQFENILEVVTLAGVWDAKKKYWLLSEELAMEFILYAEGLVFCTDELLGYNISFSLH
jgi:hypothetical protein